MLSRWIRSLTGRRRIAVPIHMPSRKSGVTARPMESLLSTMAEVEELLVPLTLRPDLDTCPLVNRGDAVAALAALSRPEGEAALATFSPAQGVVEELTTVDTQYVADLPAVRLRLVAGGNGHGSKVDHHTAKGLRTEQINPAVQTEDMRQVLADLAGVEDLPATLDGLGVVTAYGGRAEPLGALLRRAAAAQVNLLVINAIQSEPRLGSHRRLVLEATQAVATGARAVANYLSLRRATLLVSAGRRIPTAVIRQLRRCRTRVVPVRTSYPGDAESIVLKRLFGRTQVLRRQRVPGDDSRLDARCLMLPADAVWRIGLALLHRQPVVMQPITVAGDCLESKRQAVYLVPIGLTIAGLMRWLNRRNILLEQPRTIILGGPMSGSAVTDPSRTVIDPTTQAVLFTHHRSRLDSTACIRCGWCVYACPARIDPIAILDALEARRLDALARLAALRCIDCGVCSSVCPSHLPLAQAAQTAKALLSRSV